MDACVRFSASLHAIDTVSLEQVFDFTIGQLDPLIATVVTCDTEAKGCTKWDCYEDTDAQMSVCDVTWECSYDPDSDLDAC